MVVEKEIVSAAKNWLQVVGDHQGPVGNEGSKTEPGGNARRPGNATKSVLMLLNRCVPQL